VESETPGNRLRLPYRGLEGGESVESAPRRYPALIGAGLRSGLHGTFTAGLRSGNVDDGHPRLGCLGQEGQPVKSETSPGVLRGQDPPPGEVAATREAPKAHAHSRHQGGENWTSSRDIKDFCSVAIDRAMGRNLSGGSHSGTRLAPERGPLGDRAFVLRLQQPPRLCEGVQRAGGTTSLEIKGHVTIQPTQAHSQWECASVVPVGAWASTSKSRAGR